MELTPISFRDLSEIEAALFKGVGPTTGDPILVVRFVGTCGIGSGSNDDADFMRAVVVAALDVWWAAGLVLDLRELAYEWGDQMTGVLCGGDRFCGVPSLPTTVAVSDLCREGLTSLVGQEIGDDPKRWLFEDLEAAVAELEAQIQASRQREVRHEKVRPTRIRVTRKRGQ